jgi:hypothetical protein
MKHSILTALCALVFVLAGFSTAFGQTTQVKFRRGATNRPYSGAVAKTPKLYRVQLLRGSVLFLSAKGNVNYKVRAAGQVVRVDAGGEFVSSRLPELSGATSYLIEVSSASGQREKYTLYVSATVLK